MNRLFKTILLTFIITLLILPLFARTATNANETGRKWSMEWVDISQLNMTISNYGIFGHNVLTGDAGGYWPAGFPAENYLYGCGIWFGALIDTGFKVVDGDTIILKDTLVSVGYNPNSGASEMSPGDGSDAPLYSNPYEMVYKSTTNWPPNDADGIVIFDSTVSMQDTYCEYSDKDAGQHFTIENKPLGFEIRQSTYAWVGPLKEDIVFMVFRIKNARDDEKSLNKCFVGVATDCDIGNESGSAANDLLGFIDTMTYEGKLMQMNLGYQFQLESEAGWAHDPGIVAFKYMQSPIVTEPIDIYHDGSVVINPGIDTIIDTLTGKETYKPREIGMTTFNYFTLATDPTTKQERYQVLAGYNHLNWDPNNPESCYSPFPDWGSNNTGYPGQNMPSASANDQRFLMASGPFTLQNDSTSIVVVAVMVAKTVDELLPKAITAQSVYDAGFKGPVAPDIVNFSAKGLNEKVILYWDNSVEKIADPYYEDAGDPLSLLYNPTYREFDVEGYRVYRSSTGAGGTWDLLAQYDLINDFTAVICDSTIVYDETGTPTVTYLYESLGTNTGVPYFYLDSNLVNGISYHYMINAYDYNFNGYNVHGVDTIPAEPLFLEGAGKDITTLPRMPTLNYISPTYDIVIDSTFTTFDYDGDTVEATNVTIHPVDQSKLDISINLIVDTLIEEIPEGTYFSLKFVNIGSTGTHPFYTYSLFKHIGGIETGVFVDSTIMEMEDYIFVTDEDDIKTIWKRKNSGAITYNGIVFGINDFEVDASMWPATDSFLETKTYGAYDESILKMGFVPTAKLFFSGSKWYQIIWKEVTINDTLNLTCEIWDKQNNIEIPYDSSAIGFCWHFNNSTASGPYNQYMKENSPTNTKLGLYLPYIKMMFNQTTRPSAMNWADRPADGDIWDILINIQDSTIYEMPPMGSEFSVNYTPSEFGEIADSQLNNIKVVPNPYVVRCEFDLDYTYRKIYFTNLPNKCTIHIYTLSGDKIKTIEHNTEFYRYNSATDSTLVNDITNGAVSWNVLTDNDQIPAPGLYLYKVIAPSGASFIGKFAIIK